MKYDYVFLQELYNADERRQLRSCVEQVSDFNITDSPAKGVKKTANVACFMYKDAAELLRKLRHRVLDINKNCFGLDLFETSDYEILHYNTYKSETQAEYGWHTDACKNECQDIKLTALLNVSENFTGGKFELFLNGPTEIKEFSIPGTLLVFPSWIPHRVTAVLTGERLSISQFYTGPNLK